MLAAIVVGDATLLSKHPILATLSPHLGVITSELGKKFGCLPMWVSRRPYDAPRAYGLDWMLVSVGLMALALLAASLIRTVPSHAVAAFGTKIGGIRSLSQSEQLIVFEDHDTHGAADWSSGRRDATQLGLGAIWMAEPADAAMTRRIVLPAQTRRVIVTLDLIAIDSWALERLELSVNGAPVVRQSFSAAPELIARQQTEILPRDGVLLRSTLATPQEFGFATGTGQEEIRLSIEMAIVPEAPELRLSILPLPAPDAPADARPPVWAIDNLMVIAADQ